MREHMSDPDQSSWPGRPSRRYKEGGGKKRVRLTLAHMAGITVVLALLVISIFASLAGGAGISYAHTDGPVVPMDDPTPTATSTSSPTPNPTPTQKPTPTPTQPPRKTPTPIPTIPPVIPPTATATASASPTATSTSITDTPTPAITPTTAAPVSTNNSGTSKPTQSGGGGALRVVLIVLGSLLLLAFCLGVGWLMFRHMLMPPTEVRLPPSGARPWSRTRAPDPNPAGGAGASMDQFNRNAAMAFGTSAQGNVPTSNSYAPNMQSFEPGQMSFPGSTPGGYAPQANSYGGFSDSFIPPSPQIFPQSETSMIPPGSGIFPAINNANGFAPASNAFSAMYGMPGEPFTDTQAGAPGWAENQSNGNGLRGGPVTPQSPLPPVPQPPQPERQSGPQNSNWLQ